MRFGTWNVRSLKRAGSLTAAGRELANSGLGRVASTCECGNEPSGSIKFREFLDWAENRLAFQEGLCCME